MNRIQTALLIIGLLAVLPLGCMAVAGSEDSSLAYEQDWGSAGLAGGSSAPAPTSSVGDYRAAKAEEWAYDWDDGLADEAELARGIATTDQPASGEDAARTTKAVEGRKLVWTGSVSVLVDEYEPFKQSLDQQLDQLGGFVANADLSHYSGHVSWATLTVRIPSDQFETLVAWTEAEVEVQSLNIGTQDVTEEWVDIRSRIENGKRTEKRLLELLEERTATLGDVLAVERELARVRGEIEAAEGRMRVLADQVELATLTISVSVRDPYEPTVERGLGQKIADTFVSSLEAMLVVGEGLLIGFVALAPWLLLMAIFLYAFYRVVRFLIRRKSA